ncbi:hypothetical protein [Curtobacterium sp. 24E2]|nr:hypothetical protein JN350_10970 [Curtobacterium sp. 24E2]
MADADTIPAEVLPFLEEEQRFIGSQEEPDTSLAILIANDERISVESRVYLLKSSGVTLSAAAVEVADVLGGLVEIGVVEDDAATARQAVALGPSALADFVSVSEDWAAIAARIGIALPSDGVAAILSSADMGSSDIAATVDLLPSWGINDGSVLKSATARCVEVAEIKLSVSALAWIASAAPRSMLRSCSLESLKTLKRVRFIPLPTGWIQSSESYRAPAAGRPCPTTPPSSLSWCD